MSSILLAIRISSTAFDADYKLANSEHASKARLATSRTILHPQVIPAIPRARRKK